MLAIGHQHNRIYWKKQWVELRKKCLLSKATSWSLVMRFKLRSLLLVDTLLVPDLGLADMVECTWWPCLWLADMVECTWLPGLWLAHLVECTWWPGLWLADMVECTWWPGRGGDRVWCRRAGSPVQCTVTLWFVYRFFFSNFFWEKGFKKGCLLPVGI